MLAVISPEAYPFLWYSRSQLTCIRCNCRESRDHTPELQTLSLVISRVLQSFTAKAAWVPPPEIRLTYAETLGPLERVVKDILPPWHNSNRYLVLNEFDDHGKKWARHLKEVVIQVRMTFQLCRVPLRGAHKWNVRIIH